MQINNQMKERIKNWKEEFLSEKKKLVIALLFLFVSMILYLISGYEVSKVQSPKVPDLILNNLPSIDLSIIYVYGFLFVLIMLLIYPMIFNARKFPYLLEQFSLLVFLRSIFISLTHLSAPAGEVIKELPNFFAFLDFPNALFFSGHTAVPFLGYLIYRKEKLGKLFLIMTGVMMATVLFMHVHYSIDVFAALFIAYGSYKIGEYLFLQKS